MKALAVLVSLLSLALVPMWGGEAEAKRLADSTSTLTEIMGVADKGIPKDLMDKASCAIVVPGVKKGGFIVAAKYGRGFASCRGSIGGWRAPAPIRVEGGSVGFQIGGSGTDVVMLVMSQKGMEKLTSSKFTLGGDASVAGGPVGREANAQTDASMHADILSWSKSRGVFAGVALDGATLRPDTDATKALYGSALDNKDIVEGKVKTPDAAKDFIGTLDRISPKQVK